MSWATTTTEAWVLSVVQAQPAPLPNRIGPFTVHDLAEHASIDPLTASACLAAFFDAGMPVNEEYHLCREGWARGATWWITTTAKETRQWRAYYVVEACERLRRMLALRPLVIAGTGTTAQANAEIAKEIAIGHLLASVIALATKK